MDKLQFRTDFTVTQLYALNLVNQEARKRDVFLDHIKKLDRQFAPNGTVFKSHLNLLLSDPQKLVFDVWCNHTALKDGDLFHNTGWTGHRVTITPFLAHGVEIAVTGENKDSINGTLIDIFFDVSLIIPANWKELIP